MELLTVKNTTKAFPVFTESALRWLLFHRDKNGLSQAIVKIGNRVFIDKEAFSNWLESKRENEGVKIDL